jgi:hypothetical protein
LEVAADNIPGIASYTKSGAKVVTAPYRMTDKYGVEHTKINMVFTDTDPQVVSSVA